MNTFHFIYMTSWIRRPYLRPCLSSIFGYWPCFPVKVWANTILIESSPELSRGGSFRGHSVSSQLIHKMTHTVRLLWAICEFASHTAELAMRHSWDYLMIHHAVVAVGSLWDLQNLRKLTASSLWAHLVNTPWAR